MTSDIDSQGYQQQQQQQQQQQHQQQIGILKYQRFFQGNESYMWKCNILKSAFRNGFNATHTHTQTPGVNFTDILHASFMHADPKIAKNTVNSSSFLHFWDLWV